MADTVDDQLTAIAERRRKALAENAPLLAQLLILDASHHPTLMPWDRNRPRSTAYGSAHTKARQAWAARHTPSDPCTRCGHELGPMSAALHLDHSDDRRTYLGFAHGSPCPVCRIRCNQSAGARAGRARQTSSPLRW